MTAVLLSLVPMKTRSRIHSFITPGLLCQLLVVFGVFTAEIPARAANKETRAQSSPASVRESGEEAILRAREQEKSGAIYTLRGAVEIDYKNLILYADRARYNTDTGEVTASGHVVVDGGPRDEHIQGSHAQYNLRTETGKFYDAAGTTGIKFKGTKSATLTSSSPFAFTGKIVEKQGPDRYVVLHGTVTSCELPHPKWTFSAARVVVDVGETAKIYNSAFKIKKVPVFYSPFFRHPVEKLPRESGFLLPSYGISSRKGAILGDAFYWAINRSLDATLGAEYWSALGWAQHGQLRLKPSNTSYLQANYFGVLDRAHNKPSQLDLSGKDLRLNGSALLPHDIHSVISAEYLSSYLFRLGFAETFAQAINSEVKSTAFLSKNENGFFYNAEAERYQNFQSTLPGDVVTIQHLPSLEATSVERSIGDSRFFWSFDSAVAGISRTDPTFHTAPLVGRFDLYPNISYSLVSHGWSLRPEIGARNTFYTQRRLPTSGIGTTQSNPVDRRDAEASLELRPPTLDRIFRKPVFQYRLKHVIEPRIIYRYVQGVDNFDNIIRFDARDILSDTNEVEVGLVNRLYAKHVAPANCPQELSEPQPADENALTARADCQMASPREVLTWELGEKYFLNRNFGGALVPGKRNVFTSTVEFTGIAFLTEPRRLSPVISRLRLHPTLSSSLEWDLDYDAKKGRISSSSVFADYRIRQIFFGAGHTLLQSPGEIFLSNTIASPIRFNQFRLSAGYGNPNQRGFTAASTTGFDAESGFAQYVAAQTTYNWDCCGVTVEFRRLALGAVRNENQFRFAFTIANIGTFGTLKRQERVY